jgi:hypothetical protein
MSKPGNEIKKVKLEYIKPLDYEPKYATGVFGSPTPKGDIVMNFFSDLPTLPNAQFHTIVDGKLGAEINEKREPSFIRYGDTITMHRHIQTGVIMNVREAKAFHEWLGNTIKNLDDFLTDTSK